MTTTGSVLGPRYDPYLVETESSGQKCVKLGTAGQYVEFIAAADANALVIRCSVPDSAEGGGAESSLTLFIGGKPVRTLAPGSHYSWLYGTYPFSNRPAEGKPRNFYDELRVKGLKISRGDVIRLQNSAADGPACIIDLVDLGECPAPAQCAGECPLRSGIRGGGKRRHR